MRLITVHYSCYLSTRLFITNIDTKCLANTISHATNNVTSYMTCHVTNNVSSYQLYDMSCYQQCAMLPTMSHINYQQCVTLPKIGHVTNNIMLPTIGHITNVSRYHQCVTLPTIGHITSNRSCYQQ
jgi:hypothetical protein